MKLRLWIAPHKANWKKYSVIDVSDAKNKRCIFMTNQKSSLKIWMDLNNVKLGKEHQILLHEVRSLNSIVVSLEEITSS